MENLLLALPHGIQALEKVKGITYHGRDGELVSTQPQPLIPDLDSQPWPDREQVDIPRYLKVWRKHHGLGSISVITARGCPYHCRWCSHSTYGKTHRRRSARKVAEEVAWIVDRYQPDRLWMADDVFTIHPGWILEYSQELKARRLAIPFECITRADRLNARMAAALAELGCFRVWIGSESGSQRILDAMQRGVTVQQVGEAIRLCREQGIATGVFLMWGYEGEELSDIEATIEHVKQCQPDLFLTTVAYPIKGTPYYEEVAPRLVSPGSWSQQSDRQLQIKGRHSRRYYHYADQLLRSEVAREQLLRAKGEASKAEALSRVQETIRAARQGLAAEECEVEA